MRRLDPGSVYSDQSGRLYLAIGPGKAATRKGVDDGARWVEVKRGPKWRREPDISTERLCWSWGVAVSDLDALAQKYFSAPEPPKDATPSYRGEIKRQGRSGPIVYRVRSAEPRAW